MGSLIEKPQFNLSCEAIDEKGAGLGRWEEREIAVEGLFPQEQGEVELLTLSRHHPRGVARLLKRTREHFGRRSSPCRHHQKFPANVSTSDRMPSGSGITLPKASAEFFDAGESACTGCPLIELDYASQLSAKKAALLRIYDLAVDDMIGLSEHEFGYRHSVKRVVFGEPGNLQLGSYVRGSHQAAAMDDCLVDHPRIVEVLHELKQVANAQGIVPYDETRGQGDLRFVWCKSNGQEVLLTFVSAEANREKMQALASSLTLSVGVAWSIQSNRGNAMQGQQLQWLCGEKSFLMKWEQHSVEVGASDFVQPNPMVAAQAYRALVAEPSETLGPSKTAAGTSEPSGTIGPARPSKSGRLAYDLYAGTGLTTQWLSHQFAEVRACELHQGCLHRSEIENMSTESFLAKQIDELARAPQGANSMSKPELIIANPPRSGLGQRVCQQLLSIAAPSLHIMSCHPKSLKRDLESLAPHYQLVCLRGYDTLPQTPHVELVAWLRRRDDDF